MLTTWSTLHTYPWTVMRNGRPISWVRLTSEVSDAKPSHLHYKHCSLWYDIEMTKYLVVAHVHHTLLNIDSSTVGAPLTTLMISTWMGNQQTGWYFRKLKWGIRKDEKGERGVYVQDSIVMCPRNFCLLDPVEIVFNIEMHLWSVGPCHVIVWAYY